jgi:hypothetical protein
VFTDGGLAYLTNDDRFVGVPGRAQQRSVFHGGGQGGWSLAFDAQEPAAHAGGAFGRGFRLAR